MLRVQNIIELVYNSRKMQMITFYLKYRDLEIGAIVRALNLLAFYHQEEIAHFQRVLVI